MANESPGNTLATMVAAASIDDTGVAPAVGHSGAPGALHEKSSPKTENCNISQSPKADSIPPDANMEESSVVNAGHSSMPDDASVTDNANLAVDTDRDSTTKKMEEETNQPHDIQSLGADGVMGVTHDHAIAHQAGEVDRPALPINAANTGQDAQKSMPADVPHTTAENHIPPINSSGAQLQSTTVQETTIPQQPTEVDGASLKTEGLTASYGGLREGAGEHGPSKKYSACEGAVDSDHTDKLPQAQVASNDLSCQCMHHPPSDPQISTSPQQVNFVNGGLENLNTWQNITPKEQQAPLSVVMAQSARHFDQAPVYHYSGDHMTPTMTGNQFANSMYGGGFPFAYRFTRQPTLPLQEEGRRIDAYVKLCFDDGNEYYIKNDAVVFGRAETVSKPIARAHKPDSQLSQQKGGRSSKSKHKKAKSSMSGSSASNVGPRTPNNSRKSSIAMTTHTGLISSYNESARPFFTDPFGAKSTNTTSDGTGSEEKEALIHLPPTGEPVRKNISRRHARLSYNEERGAFEFKVMGKNGAFVEDEWVECGSSLLLGREGGHVRPTGEKAWKIQIGGIGFALVFPSSHPQEVEEAAALKVPKKADKDSMSMAFLDGSGREVTTDVNEEEYDDDDEVAPSNDEEHDDNDDDDDDDDDHDDEEDVDSELEEEENEYAMAESVEEMSDEDLSDGYEEDNEAVRPPPARGKGKMFANIITRPPRPYDGEDEDEDEEGRMQEGDEQEEEEEEESSSSEGISDGEEFILTSSRKRKRPQTKPVARKNVKTVKAVKQPKAAAITEIKRGRGRPRKEVSTIGTDIQKAGAKVPTKAPKKTASKAPKKTPAKLGKKIPMKRVPTKQQHELGNEEEDEEESEREREIRLRERREREERQKRIEAENRKKARQREELKRHWKEQKAQQLAKKEAKDQLIKEREKERQREKEMELKKILEMKKKKADAEEKAKKEAEFRKLTELQEKLMKEAAKKEAAQRAKQKVKEKEQSKGASKLLLPTPLPPSTPAATAPLALPSLQLPTASTTTSEEPSAPIKRSPGRPPKSKSQQSPSYDYNGSSYVPVGPSLEQFGSSSQHRSTMSPAPLSHKSPMNSSATYAAGKEPRQQKAPREPKPKKEKPVPKRKRSPSPPINEADLPPEALLKPNASYLILIHEAISNSEKGSLSLPDIYRAIQRKYPYFKCRVTTTGWQSSVRHNLSQSHAFEKVEREGKGWLWKITDGFNIEKEKKKKQLPPPPVSQIMHPGTMPHPQYIQQPQMIPMQNGMNGVPMMNYGLVQGQPQGLPMQNSMYVMPQGTSGATPMAGPASQPPPGIAQAPYVLQQPTQYAQVPPLPNPIPQSTVGPNPALQRPPPSQSISSTSRSPGSSLPRAPIPPPPISNATRIQLAQLATQRAPEPRAVAPQTPAAAPPQPTATVTLDDASLRQFEKLLDHAGKSGVAGDLTQLRALLKLAMDPTSGEKGAKAKSLLLGALEQLKKTSLRAKSSTPGPSASSSTPITQQQQSPQQLPSQPANVPRPPPPITMTNNSATPVNKAPQMVNAPVPTPIPKPSVQAPVPASVNANMPIQAPQAPQAPQSAPVSPTVQPAQVPQASPVTAPVQAQPAPQPAPVTAIVQAPQAAAVAATVQASQAPQPAPAISTAQTAQAPQVAPITATGQAPEPAAVTTTIQATQAPQQAPATSISATSTVQTPLVPQPAAPAPTVQIPEESKPAPATTTLPTPQAPRAQAKAPAQTSKGVTKVTSAQLMSLLAKVKAQGGVAAQNQLVQKLAAIAQPAANKVAISSSSSAPQNVTPQPTSQVMSAQVQLQGTPQLQIPNASAVIQQAPKQESPPSPQQATTPVAHQASPQVPSQSVAQVLQSTAPVGPQLIPPPVTYQAVHSVSRQDTALTVTQQAAPVAPMYVTPTLATQQVNPLDQAVTAPAVSQATPPLPQQTASPIAHQKVPPAPQQVAQSVPTQSSAQDASQLTAASVPAQVVPPDPQQQPEAPVTQQPTTPLEQQRPPSASPQPAEKGALQASTVVPQQPAKQVSPEPPQVQPRAPMQMPQTQPMKRPIEEVSGTIAEEAQEVPPLKKVDVGEGK